jgi:hypothetical protein
VVDGFITDYQTSNSSETLEYHNMSRRNRLKALILVFIVVYFRLWITLQSSASITHYFTPQIFDDSPFAAAGTTTKIVAFCDNNYRSVGVKWYERMTRLGYTTHVIIATDLQLKSYLTDKNIRVEVALPEPIPAKFMHMKKFRQNRVRLELLFAVRWKYLLVQLKEGNHHILLTDVDNIFSRFIDIQKEIETKDLTVDVWHAYATKFPAKNFAQLGFTVCGGMSWWRNSRPAIHFAELIHEKCGILCDDQRVLNNLLLDPGMKMTWHWTPAIQNSRISNHTTIDERLIGLPQLGITGKSNTTGHKTRVWDRDFAYRGLILSKDCPISNWVSMPIVTAQSRTKNWIAKLESFDIWDKACRI